MTRRTHRTVGAALVAATLLLTSCSSSGGDEADDTTTTEAAETTTTAADTTETTEAGGEVDADAQARAESIDITLSDFPDGWESAPAEDSGDDGVLGQCDPATADDSDELAEYRTDQFTLGDLDTGGTLVGFDTKVFTDDEAAIAAVAPLSDPEVLSCVGDGIAETFNAEGEFTADDVGDAFDVDETVAASGTYTVAGTDGEETQLNVGYLVMRTGDLATLASVISTDADFDITSLQPVFEQVATLQADA